MTATGLKHTTVHNSVRKRTLNHLIKLAKWLCYVVSSYMYGTLTTCFYHVTYALRVSFLNVKEVLTRNSCDIWSLMSDSHLPKNCFICFNESPLKMMKIIFISSWKLFSLSRYLNFCLGFSSYRRNGLIRKISLFSKFTTSQPS